MNQNDPVPYRRIKSTGKSLVSLPFVRRKRDNEAFVASREADIVVENAIREFQAQKELEKQRNRGGLFGWFGRNSSSFQEEKEVFWLSLGGGTDQKSPPPTLPATTPKPVVPPPLTFSPGKTRSPNAAGPTPEAEREIESALNAFERQQQKPVSGSRRLLQQFLARQRSGGATDARPRNLPPPPTAPQAAPTARRGERRDNRRPSHRESVPDAPPPAVADEIPRFGPESALPPVQRAFLGKGAPILSREAEFIVNRAIALFRAMRQEQERRGPLGRFFFLLRVMQQPLKFGLILGLVVLVLLFLDGASQEKKELSARFAALEGKVTVKKRIEKKEIKATLKIPLINRDVDITGPDGRAVMVFPDGSAVEQAPSTKFTVLLLDYGRTGRRDRSFFLQYGAIFTRISHHFGANGQTLITTPNAVAAARGTGFTVRHLPQRRSTLVEVAHGTVLLRNVGGSLLIHAGERAVAVGDNPPYLLTMDGAQFQRIATHYRRLGVFELDPNYTLPEDIFHRPAAVAGNNTSGSGSAPVPNIGQALGASLASAKDREAQGNTGIPSGPSAGSSVARRHLSAAEEAAFNTVSLTGVHRDGSKTKILSDHLAAAKDHSKNGSESSDEGDPETPIKLPNLPQVGGDGFLAGFKTNVSFAEKKLFALSDPLLQKFGYTVQGWNFNATNAARRAACEQALHRIQESIASQQVAEAVNPVTLEGSGLDTKTRDTVQEALGGSVLESYQWDKEKGYVIRARARDDQGTLYELTEAGVRLIPEPKNAAKLRIEEQDDLTPGAEQLKRKMENALKNHEK